MPRDYPDPFGPAAREPNISWHRSYKLRYQRQYYPNSGLLMGTAAGFEGSARLSGADYEPAAINVRLVGIRSLVFKTNDNRTSLHVQ